VRRGLRCHDAAVRATYAKCEMQRAARQGQDMGRAQQNDRLCDTLLAGDTKSAWRRAMLVRGARSRVRQLCEKQMVLQPNPTTCGAYTCVQTRGCRPRTLRAFNACNM
jgi:hypothetical protein